MKAAVGYSENTDSKLAAREAVATALSNADRSDICDVVLLFATSSHNQEVLRAEVAELTGNKTAIYGGGAIGIITNDTFGYAGSQVGVALIWQEGSECNVLVEENLSADELEKGKALGKKMAEAGIKPDSPVMLFYDAMKAVPSDVNMTMATWILEGLQQGLGYFPDINGAGLQADFIGGTSAQYIGDSIKQDTIMAMAFSDDVCIDSIIMHGCHPASPYFTVTKSNGPIILEIDGEPAIPFMDKLLGGSIKPEQYPFFLLFGINHGEKWGEYDEKNYASRLCLGIAPECNGIVMFEPDMVPGTQFQLMFRSLDMEYIQPKVEEVLGRLDGREPAFAMYIDCGGRAAGYNGVDVEDAYAIQKALGKDIPLLGMYTGVEIAEIGGRPRGLDWTGVLCIFSTTKDGQKKKTVRQESNAWAEKNADADDSVSVEAVLKLSQQNAAKVLQLDTQSIAIRYELELKRRGFKLLSELTTILHQDTTNEEIFRTAAARINAALNMQRTAVLQPDGNGNYVPSVLQGYSDAEKEEIMQNKICITEDMIDFKNPLIVTGADSAEYHKDLREALKINYFILTPVAVEGEVTAILISGRMMEAPPFLSRLGVNDIENVQAISGLLATVLVYEKLDTATKRANTDALTGLLNRRALEARVVELLKNQYNQYALMIIDFDYFKQVNDTYGHTAGDLALQTLAQTLQSVFRSTDLIARIGGDEFVVFFQSNGTEEQVIRKAEQLRTQWNRTAIETEKGKTFRATLSVGIAETPKNADTYLDLFGKADLALYQSKEKGRDQFAIYNKSMEK